MEPLRLDTLAAQVVAWHNRHPLARRITAAQVHSMGYVVLPGMQVCVPEAVPAPPAPVELAEPNPASERADPTQPEAELAAVEAPAEDASTAPAQTAAADPAPAAAPLDDLPSPEPEAPPLQPGDGAEVPAELQPDAQAAEFATDPVGEFPADAAPDVAPDADPDADPNAHPTAAAEPAPEPAADAPEPAGAVEAVPSLRERLTARPAHAAPPAPSPAKTGVHTQAHPHAPPAQAAAGVPPPADSARPDALNPHSQPFRVAFSEPFLDHSPAPQVAQWAQAHACVLAVPLPVGAAVRQVVRDPVLSAARPGLPERPVDLLLRTATLELGRHRQRLLLGPGVDPAVLGRRLWSLPRVAVACLPLLLLPLTGGLAWWLGAQSARLGPHTAQAGHGVAAAPAPGASAQVAAVDHPASHPVADPASHPASQAANPDAAQAFTAYAAQAASAAQAAAQAAALAAAAAAEPPIDTEPRLGQVALPPLGPLFSDERFEPTRQRRLAERAARAAPALAAAATEPATTAEASPSHAPANDAANASANAPTRAPTKGPANAPAAAPATPAANLPPAAYALTTRPLRTAAESEQVQAAMRTLLALTADRAAKVERVPVGDDWRVMGGPFASRAAAERARALLLARGVKTEVTEIPPPPAMAAAAVTIGR